MSSIFSSEAHYVAEWARVRDELSACKLRTAVGCIDPDSVFSVASENLLYYYIHALLDLILDLCNPSSIP